MTSGSTLAIGRRLAHGEAIVDGVDGARHRPGLVRCEESEESCHLPGLSHAPGPKQPSYEVWVYVVGKDALAAMFVLVPQGRLH